MAHYTKAWGMAQQVNAKEQSHDC